MYKEMFDLSGKVALVTGSSRGLGSEIAVGLAELGADVIVSGQENDHCGETMDRVKALGRKTFGYGLDVAQEDQVNKMMKRVVDEFGRIDILVNCAGINSRQPAETFPIDDWQRVMDVNVRGTFLCSKAAAPHMIERKSGKIVNVSSVRGRYGLPENYAAYSTSKGAVDTLTRTLACEWAKHNIMVNAIAPTIIETQQTAPALADPEFAARMKARIPMGRWGFLSDVVGPTAFLASSASDFVTGQILYVDGGVTTW